MKEFIKTKSFKLAVLLEGDPSSDRLAFFLPGRHDTKDYAHVVSHLKFFAKAGYYAISFDPPGTWESEGDPSIYTMTNYLKALSELIDHFGARPSLVAGHSRGGSVAMFSAIRDDRVFAFISIMSHHSFYSKKGRDFSELGYKLSYRDLPPGGGPKVKEMRLYRQFHLDELNYDAAEGLKGCNKPKLFIAGTLDQTTSLSEIKLAYDLSADPKEFKTIESDHDYRLYPALIEGVEGIMSQFLSKLDD